MLRRVWTRLSPAGGKNGPSRAFAPRPPLPLPDGMSEERLFAFLDSVRLEGRRRRRSADIAGTISAASFTPGVWPAI